MRLMLSCLLLAVALSSPAFAEPYDKARVVARTEIWKEINSGMAGSATVAIMDGGKVVYAEGFGMADREASIPVDPHTIFNIGSISKVFTATAIMLLVDDGKVRLDEPVTTYIPEFRMADPRYRDITVRMLLDHSSGLPGTTGQNDFGFRYNPGVFPQILANLAQSHLKHAPGAQAPYTNDGFSLAEIVVERVSGQRFMDFLAQRVFQPLSMVDTGVGVGDRTGRTAAVFYDPETGRREPLETLSLLGAGGLSSTAVDLCRFQDSFSGSGPQILSPASLAEMRKEQPTPFTGRLRHSALAFGLGWDMTDLPNYRAQGIQVMGKSGGTGRYTSFMFNVPQHRISVAVIEAAESGKAMQICKDVLDAVLEEKGLLAATPDRVAKPLQPQPIPASYAAYAGTYVPFQKIAFDRKKNVATVSVMEFGEEPRTLSLFYNGGSFHDGSGGIFEFQTVDGQDYFLKYLAEFDLDMISGQKVPMLAKPLNLRVPVDGKRWLVRNSLWFDGVQGTGGHVLTSRTFRDLPGYVDFGGLLRIESRDFAGMPASNIRDQRELTLVEQGGETWARLSEALYSPAASAPVLQAGTRTVTVGPDGYSQWLRVGKGLLLSFEAPAESRVLVFSPKGEPVWDGMLDSGPVYAEPGSFVEFLGAPGAAFEVKAQ